MLISALGFLGGALLHNLFGVIFTYFPLIAFYFALPVLLTDLHRNLPSAQRATGESFVSLLARVTMIPLGFAFAFLSDHRSIFAAFFGLGVVLATYLLVISLPKGIRLRNILR